MLEQRNTSTWRDAQLKENQNQYCKVILIRFHFYYKAEKGLYPVFTY